jgi:hypothetical protein
MPGLLPDLAAKFQQADSEKLRANVYLVQVGVGAFFIALLLLFRKRDEKTFFRSGGKGEGRNVPHPEPTLAGPALGYEPRRPRPSAKKAEPLRLPGIRIDGTPHEILGVSPQATRREIQKAYRNLMKRYHPDVVAPAGTPQWKEAQKIAEAINRAKELLLGK